LPLRDLDESKPVNPLPLLIRSILSRFANNPNIKIKKIFIKKIDDDNEHPERQLKGTQDEVHELVD